MKLSSASLLVIFHSVWVSECYVCVSGVRFEFVKERCVMRRVSKGKLWLMKLSLAFSADVTFFVCG